MPSRRQVLTPRVPGALLALTALVRLGLALAALSYSGDATLFANPDTSTYLEPARSLTDGEFRTAGEPEIRRTPGYPLLLVPGVVLGQVAAVTIALQIALSVASAWLVFRLAFLLFESRTLAAWAVLLYALEPLSVLLSVKLLSETLFTFLMLLGLYWLFLHFRYGRVVPLLGAAFVLAASVYVRPIAYYLPIVVGSFLLFGPQGRFSPRRAAHALGFVALSAALIGAWQLRNHALAGYPRFSGNEDVNLWLYSLALAGEEQGGGFLAKKAEVGQGPIGYWKLHPEELMRPLRDRLADLRAQAKQTIARRPLRYLAIHLEGCANTLLNPGARSLMGLFVRAPGPDTPGWLLLAGVLAAVLLSTYALAAWGLLATLRGAPFTALFLLAVVGYFALLSGGPIGTSRYRQPLMPLFCMAAAAGLASLSRGLDARRLARAGEELAGRARHRDWARAGKAILARPGSLTAIGVAARVKKAVGSER